MAGNPFVTTVATLTAGAAIVFSTLTSSALATDNSPTLSMGSNHSSYYEAPRPWLERPYAVIPKLDLAFEAPGRRLEPLASPPPVEAPKTSLVRRAALRLFGAPRDRVPVRSRPGFNANA